LLNTFRGLVRLTRHQDYLTFVTITTLFGAIAAEAILSWRLVLVWLANLLTVCFAFMINDVEDAEDDALNPAKLNRNPISDKTITPRAGYLASALVAALAAVAYSPLGRVPFLLGLVGIATSFIYSWKPVRLKNIFLLDMISHGMMLAGLQYLPSFYTFQSNMTLKGLFPFLFMISFSLYGELFNELRDLEHDLKAGLRHTAAILGYQTTFRLMVAIAALGVISGFVSLFFVKLLPLWFLIFICALTLVFITPSLLKLRQKQTQLEIQRAFQVPIQNAAAIALVVYFIVQAL